MIKLYSTPSTCLLIIYSRYEKQSYAKYISKYRITINVDSVMFACANRKKADGSLHFATFVIGHVGEIGGSRNGTDLFGRIALRGPDRESRWHRVEISRRPP